MKVPFIALAGRGLGQVAPIDVGATLVIFACEPLLSDWNRRIARRADDEAEEERDSTRRYGDTIRNRGHYVVISSHDGAETISLMKIRSSRRSATPTRIGNTRDGLLRRTRALPSLALDRDG
jgi:hypothetical protein